MMAKEHEISLIMEGDNTSSTSKNQTLFTEESMTSFLILAVRQHTVCKTRMGNSHTKNTDISQFILDLQFRWNPAYSSTHGNRYANEKRL